MTARIIHQAGLSPVVNDFDDIMRNLFSETKRQTHTFAPAVDIEESEDAYTLHAELPGVKTDDVDISIENNTLTISGERNFYTEDGREGFRRVERRFGSFLRSIHLPEQVDDENVKATYSDGMLTIVVPKTEEAKPRRIEISVS